MTNTKRVILIIGLPGSGKTTIAKALSDKYRIQFLSTEAFRAEYLNIRKEGKDCDFTEEQQTYVYTNIASKAVSLLKKGDCLIIDGVYRSYFQRKQLYDKLREFDNLLYLKLWIKCKKSIEIARLIERKNTGTICPAGVEGFRKIEEIFEPPKPEEKFIRIDNSFSLDSTLQNIFASIDGILK